MKVGAHPMVVAVALGFLSPQALAEDERREDEPCATPCVGCDCDAAPARADASADDASEDRLTAEAVNVAMAALER